MSTRHREDLEEYGLLLQAMGNCRFQCQLLDGNNIIAKAKGSLIKGPKKEKLEKGDWILLQQDTSSSDKKYFIVHKYDERERKILIKDKEIPKDGFMKAEKRDGIEFNNEEDEEEIQFDDI